MMLSATRQSHAARRPDERDRLKKDHSLPSSTTKDQDSPILYRATIGTGSQACQTPPPPNAHLEHLDGQGYHAACEPSSSKLAPPARKFPAAVSRNQMTVRMDVGAWCWCMAQDYRPAWSVWESQYPSGTGPTCVCVGTWKTFLDGYAPVISCVLGGLI